MTERYRLANPAATVPMPDRGGRLFSDDPQGEAIDRESRFYATMIADGDLVPVATAPAVPATPPSPPDPPSDHSQPARSAAIRKRTSKGTRT